MRVSSHCLSDGGKIPLFFLFEMKLYLNRAVVYNDFKILHQLEMRNRYE